MKVSEAIAEILKREGIEVIFGYPRNAVLETAAARGIRTVIVRQERTGLHMADAYSRMSRGKRLGVFAMQHGPGTENAYGGVAQAYSESVPVLVLPQGYARRLAHVPDNYNACLSMRDITKTAEPILRAEDTGAVLRRAFTALRNGRLRPALVELPWDVLGEELPEPLVYSPVVSTRFAPDPEAIGAVADRLVAARRLVIHAGQGVHWANAYAELRELAELLAAPVSTSLEGKSTFDETHPLALGSGGAAIPGQLRHFLDNADLIFGIGCSFSETAFGVSMPGHVPVIHATLDPADFNKGVPCELALAGDAKLTLAALIEACRARIAGPRDPEPAAREIADVEAAWLAQWLPLLESDAAPLSSYRVLWELQRSVDVANTIITHDAGSPRDQLTPFWKCITPLSYIGWGKSTQLGYGLGLAMGAKLACPDKLCINVWGDAAIGFTGMDFETAARERLPILSILLNNSAMAIELDQMPVATERFRATDISGNYADFATALGGYGERVTRPEDIRAAIERGIAATRAGQPALIEFITCAETRASRL
ncbi:thiamine pyrophosphate-requiring protein [Novosphingobium sp.]|uniref:thiamine pyrophosphate-requiring protein n=1 Tax=Novosphingobium sp. TaxID=1874826 RepID=UPI0035B3E8F4